VKLLVVNPNTTESMTRTIAAAAELVAAPSTEIIARTSLMGPVSIEGYYDEALSVPGLLIEIGKGENQGADAAIIACFDDTGLDAARVLCAIPVIGICEAALATATFLAKRFTVVTTLDRSRVPIEELCRRYGMGDRVRVRASNIPVLALEDPNSGARDRLRSEIVAAIEEDRAEAIVLGCAGMADLARTLQREFGMPVIDGVGAAVKQAEALFAQGLRTSKRGTYAPPIAKGFSGGLAGLLPDLVRA
jgi:allantoin racemase